MSKPIDVSKPVETREGHPARIIASDVKTEYPIIAVVKISEHKEVVRAYSKDGTFLMDGSPSKADLVNVPEKLTFYGWLNVGTRGHEDGVFSTRDRADAFAKPDRIACLPLEISFLEGEGL